MGTGEDGRARPGESGSPCVMRRILSSMGGCVAIRLERKPPTPSAKNRCEASSASGVESREPCFPIFWSAPASPVGFRVNWTAAASARNSRWRFTAAWMIFAAAYPTHPSTNRATPARSTTPTPRCPSRARARGGGSSR